jgi:hypothetical protein
MRQVKSEYIFDIWEVERFIQKGKRIKFLFSPGLTHADKFKNCQRDNLIAIWANEGLYIPHLDRPQFMGILEQYLKPIYDSARVQGYSIWDRKNIGI